MEYNQNQLSIQKDLDVLREQWLRKDLWSERELALLCCGCLDGKRLDSDLTRYNEKLAKHYGSAALFMGSLLIPPSDKKLVEEYKNSDPLEIAQQIIQDAIAIDELEFI